MNQNRRISGQRGRFPQPTHRLHNCYDTLYNWKIWHLHMPQKYGILPLVLRDFLIIFIMWILPHSHRKTISYRAYFFAFIQLKGPSPPAVHGILHRILSGRSWWSRYCCVPAYPPASQYHGAAGNTSGRTGDADCGGRPFSHRPPPPRTGFSFSSICMTGPAPSRGTSGTRGRFLCRFLWHS